MRKMAEEEFRSWTRAIHKACSPEWVPALRFAFANLMPFVDEGCTTAYTDCHYRIGLSPDMLDPGKTTDEQLAIVVLHETLHNVQKHAQRLEGAGLPQLVKNYVTDFEINSIIASYRNIYYDVFNTARMLEERAKGALGLARGRGDRSEKSTTG